MEFFMRVVPSSGCAADDACAGMQDSGATGCGGAEEVAAFGSASRGDEERGAARRDDAGDADADGGG
ncbi:hypothetical protein QL996_16300, partial [Planococcus sp. APC 4015]|nr:hypothetical protein [Planococcus sp. APC 4015]